MRVDGTADARRKGATCSREVETVGAAVHRLALYKFALLQPGVQRRRIALAMSSMRFGNHANGEQLAWFVDLLKLSIR